MPLNDSIDVRLDPKAVRLAMDMPRTLLSGKIATPTGITPNRRAILEAAKEQAKVLRVIFLGMSPINDTAAFSELRDEVAEFGVWVEAQLAELNAKEAK